MSRSGIYYWAGTGTERMIRLKYPKAKVDSYSLLRAYDLDVLRQSKEKLLTTDAWVTYSWGFSRETESQDYEFVKRKLANFRQLEIKTHGYVQGSNLVFDEHKNEDFFCKNYRGQLVPYHRGRKLTCVNNPNFKRYIQTKVGLAIKEAFDGIFVDNVFMGLMPLVVGNRVSGFGCYCGFCCKRFKKEIGAKIPKSFTFGEQSLTDFIDFRKRVLMEFVKDLSVLVRGSGKEFGINSFDPKLDSKFYYGTDLSELAKEQDYLLFENHDLPRKNRNNKHLSQIVVESGKPVFVVSYDKGIGRETQFEQDVFDAVFSESQKLGYSPCYKASEYTTKRVWHNLDFNQLRRVKKIKIQQKVGKSVSLKKLPFGCFLRILNRFYVSWLEIYFEKYWARLAFNWLYYRAIR